MTDPGQTLTPPAAGQRARRSPWRWPTFLVRGYVAGLILYLIYFFPIFVLTSYLGYIGPRYVDIFGSYYDLEYFYIFMVLFHCIGHPIFLKIYFVPLWLRIYLALGGRGHIFVDPDLDPDFARAEDGHRYVERSLGRILYRDYVPTKDIPFPNEENINTQKYKVRNIKEKTIPWVALLLTPPAMCICSIIILMTNNGMVSVFKLLHPEFGNFLDSITADTNVLVQCFIMIWAVVLCLKARLVFVVLYRLLGGTLDARWFFPLPALRWYNSWLVMIVAFIDWLGPWSYKPPPGVRWHRKYYVWGMWDLW